MSSTLPEGLDLSKPPVRSDLPSLTIDTQSLFAGRSEIRLVHRGVEYRLRITKLGKLILTK